MAMTAIGVLSIVLSLLALAAFLVGGIIMTIFLVREMDLPETEYHLPGGLE